MAAACSLWSSLTSRVILQSIMETIAMRNLKQSSFVVLTLLAALLSPVVWADDSSPAGLWRNIDDISGKPRALIRITELNGTLQGKIEKVFPGPDEGPNPKCEKCVGASKDAPIVGLVILSGLRRDGEEFAGGQILDPDNGKTYRSKVQLIDGGRKLNVRGYIGVPLLGRTQTWVRQE